jgi:hypothetical protein
MKGVILKMPANSALARADIVQPSLPSFSLLLVSRQLGFEKIVCPGRPGQEL